MSDYKGAGLLLDSLPPARGLLADRGYDSDWFREALIARGITPLHSAPQEPETPARVRQGAL
jgi:hypothetical protein